MVHNKTTGREGGGGGGGGKGSYMYMRMLSHIFSLSLAALGPMAGLDPEPLGSPLLDGTSVGASDETTSVA